MKVTRAHTGAYNVTAQMAQQLVQYNVSKEKGHWVITRLYGCGPSFAHKHTTKREALALLTAYID